METFLRQCTTSSYAEFTFSQNSSPVHSPQVKFGGFSSGDGRTNGSAFKFWLVPELGLASSALGQRVASSRVVVVLQLVVRSVGFQGWLWVPEQVVETEARRWYSYQDVEGDSPGKVCLLSRKSSLYIGPSGYIGSRSYPVYSAVW